LSVRLDPPFWSFDGPAHTRLFAVRQGARIDPSLEVLSAQSALIWLRRWLLDPAAVRELLDLYRVLYGDLAVASWGLGDVLAFLERTLSNAIERGDILLLEPRVAGAAAGPETLEPGPISGGVARPRPKAGAWLEIELLDASGSRFASPLRLTGPESTPTSPRFDGFVRLDGLEQGTCEIEFPEIDGREWGVTPQGAGSGIRTGFEHTVGPGECLSSISGRFGFASWRTVYDDPKNEALRRARPNPNVLSRGDVVFVPDRDPRIEDSATNRRATYRTLAAVTRLRIRFEGRRANQYELRVAGQVRTGVVSPGEMIDEPIPGDATTGELVMWPTGKPEQKDRWAIAIGGLDPVSDLRGVQARLDNLGFVCPVDGTESPETTRAIAAYQRWRGVGDGEGTLDGATRGDLEKFHDD
jgi:hypothetical protein